ncbi:von Willebrand factor A domain-containing protein 7 isoform X2 [Oncorhynchus kisutch]|uniref:von Willebrand factor A domain-containing protein 7 isoform X2 n=1 Tax=Oncorhynchus kisutch TaxID=8019 RepID=UPI0012DD6A25|nr:von Willebrand factor A domain-containing protein 7 isoform X2 [Oncorhynchus kisutch]XP_031664336.1 von Willebrand factor A domain-containing protein 7 isoform X2 [Oncorhynchus kisutch]
MMSSVLAVVSLLLLQTEVQGFLAFLSGSSMDHMEITKEAILQTTAKVCKQLASVEGRDFTLPPGPLTAESLALTCSSSGSAKSFQSAISDVTRRNARIDDFYSHSNWIELGNRFPHSNLIRSDVSDIGPVADKDTPTCRSCVGKDCQNNILENIIRDKKLTSGYFGLGPLSSTKPKGKCSHGGSLDQTSRQEPTGGINKDSLESSHGNWHTAAAEVAVAATSQLLEDIRGAAGDTDFLRLMGISKNGSKVLCFVIDTTGSMSDDIAAVRETTSFIIDSKRGTPDEPSVYILVPFNDPDFGPLMQTTDPNIFKAQINALNANGGGDYPEMSLSGLQLALTGAPPSSEIFLFTDAPAKDLDLMGTVIALIERTKSVVTFFLTGSLGLRRRRGSDQGQGQVQHSRMAVSDSQLYRELAQSSGGQAIQVTKTELPKATSIIVESSSSSLVTILQAVRSPGRADNFSFTVDESVRNLTAYVTGSSLSFTLTSPSGVSQSSGEVNGSLATITTVGNFLTLGLDSQVGLWEIRVSSTVPYSLKVVGQSAIDFLFDFVEVSQGPHPAFAVLESRPQAGGNATLLVSVTGSESVSLTEVALVEASGSGEVNGTLESVGSGDFLVTMDRIPAGEFVVRLRGENRATTRALPDSFQRQSSTRLRASTVMVMAKAESDLEPGTPFSVLFTVTTNGTGGSFTIRATNDRGFPSSSPTDLTLVTGVSANGTVTLTAPANTVSGTDVTLTIEAESPGATDTNYAVLRLTVVSPVTDVSRPVCDMVSVTANCSDDCSLSVWELSANLTDGNGTGIEHVTLRQGNGTLNTTTVKGAGNWTVTLAAYSASCCSPEVELVAVDGAGNVGTCFRSIRVTVDTTVQPPVTNATTKNSITVTTAKVATAATAAAVSSSHPLSLSSYLCSIMLVSVTLVLSL